MVWSDWLGAVVGGPRPAELVLTGCIDLRLARDDRANPRAPRQDGLQAGRDTDELLTPKELRGFDDGGVAVALNGFEVRPVLGDNLRFPPSRADCDQNIKCQTL